MRTSMSEIMWCVCLAFWTAGWLVECFALDKCAACGEARGLHAHLFSLCACEDVSMCECMCTCVGKSVCMSEW